MSRKITLAAARISKGTQDKLYLGNLNARRDWGYAKDYVEAMWLMLQQSTPEDYVVATGETHTVREFVEEAFRYVGLEWEKYIVTDPVHFRPSEVDVLVGDASKAKARLKWQPKVRFKELVQILVDAELAFLGLRRENVISNSVMSGR